MQDSSTDQQEARGEVEEYRISTDPGWGCEPFRRVIRQLYIVNPELAQAAAHPLLEAILAEPDPKKQKRMLPSYWLRRPESAPAFMRDLMITPTTAREFAAITGAFYYHEWSLWRISKWKFWNSYRFINLGEIFFIFLLVPAFFVLPALFIITLVMLIGDGFLSSLPFICVGFGLVAHMFAIGTFSVSNYPLRRGILDFRQALNPRDRIIWRFMIIGWILIIAISLIVNFWGFIFLYLICSPVIGLLMWFIFRKAPYCEYVSKRLNEYWLGSEKDFEKYGPQIMARGE